MGPEADQSAEPSSELTAEALVRRRKGVLNRAELADRFAWR